MATKQNFVFLNFKEAWIVLDDYMLIFNVAQIVERIECWNLDIPKY